MLATVGAAGVEMAEEALAETQAAVEPLVPYLDALGVHGRRATRYRRCRLCPLGRLAPGAAMIGTVVGWLAGSRWALAAAKWGAVGLMVLLFLLSVRRAGERAGRMAQHLDTLEKSNDVQRRLLEAAARRPRSRDEQELLPEGSAVVEMLGDFAVMREQARGCESP